jgi:hypothetical protein
MFRFVPNSSVRVVVNTVKGQDERQKAAPLTVSTATPESLHC